MPKLQKLRLDSNALICDCAMLWFVRMLAEHSQMSIAATCYEPAEATGTSLAAMKEKDFHCRKFYIFELKHIFLIELFIILSLIF